MRRLVEVVSRHWKGVAKALVALVILGFVGRQFYRDLSQPDLALLQIRWTWLALCPALYLAGLGFSAWFWRDVLKRLGYTLGGRDTLRGYYIGHLGKYVPGKAWAMLLRGSLVRHAAPLAPAILSAFYEVLTTMAAGALVAIGVFIVVPPEVEAMSWQPLYTGLLLLALLAVPLLPGVFNYLMLRLSRRFPAILGEDLGALRLTTLVRGLLATACGWLLLGLSVWAMLQAVLPAPPDLGAETWARITGATALAYVAGFLALVLPSGVGVREYFLLALLGFAGPEPLIAAAVLLLRLAWTASEMACAAVLWCWPRRQGAGASSH
ncbi:MAG: lysylphosphatidylglycerol synthase domain-containing protein [Gemmataceae bacterium]